MMDAATLLRLFALALCIWREARGESQLGKVLVGQTIENRVRDPRWPDTYIAVITQPLQFSAFNRSDPNVMKWPAETDAAWAESVLAARIILDAPHVFTTANHYHTVNVSPSWAKPEAIVAREGNHVFYAL